MKLLLLPCRALIYNASDDSFIRLSQSKGSANGLNCNFINFLLTDGNTIWIGTEIGGLNKMTKQNLILQSYIHDKNDPGSLSDNPVNSIFEDIYGNLWVENVEGGLNLKPKGSDTFIHFRHSVNDPHTLSHNSVSAIIEDNRHNLWVGTWGMGVNVIPLTAINDPVFTRYTVEQSIGLNSNFIGSMCFDPVNNGVWIGTNQGLHFFDLTRGELKQVPLSIDKLHNTTIVGLCIDPKSHL
ncbi:MAG: hypothetical protein LUD15_08745 [Bacteroides sp.]|nr:hypothetical protein [Bacteroides sp.]